MNRGAIIGGFWAGALAALLAVPALSQSSAPNPNQPPPHTLPYPDLGSGESLPERRKSYELAPELQRGVSAAQIRDQQRRLDSALAAIGGFNGVINLLSMNLDAEVDTQRLPFIITSQLLKPFRNLNNTLNVEFAKTFSTICKDLVIKRLSQMSDKDVKNCEKSQIDCVLKDLSQLVLIGHSQQESS